RETVGGVVLYVHGFADYFFQTELADFFAERGFAFYALDLRKSGRARRADQTAHYVSDLALYDVELERALATVTAEHPGLPVAALVLNSPWFDLQGTPVQRGPVTQALRVLAKVRPMRTLPPLPTTYGHSI